MSDPTAETQLAPIESRQHGDSIQNPDREVVVRHERVRVWRDDTSSIDGRGQAANGVRIHDGCHGFICENLYLKRCGTGIFATNSHDGKIIACVADRMGAEGFQSGGTKRLLVEDCQSFNHTENTWEGPDLGTSPDRSHGFYLDCPGTGWDNSVKGLIMRRCIGRNCDGMGLHLRGAYLLVEDSDFHDNHPGTPGGAGDCQLSGAEHVIFRRTLMAEGDSGITLYERSRDVRMEECVIWNPDGSFATSCWDNEVLVVQGGVVCGSIDKTRPSFTPSSIYYSTATPQAETALETWMRTYRPEEPTEPPVEPPTGDLEAENGDLKERIATMEAEIVAAQTYMATGRAALEDAGEAVEEAVVAFDAAADHMEAALEAAQGVKDFRTGMTLALIFVIVAVAMVSLAVWLGR